MKWADWLLKKIRGDQTSASSEWFVEFETKPLARLTNPRLDDMFWVRYELVPLDNLNEADLRNLYSEVLWNDARISFRSVATGKLVTQAFLSQDCIAKIQSKPSSVVIRGLY